LPNFERFHRFVFLIEQIKFADQQKNRPCLDREEKFSLFGLYVLGIYLIQRYQFLNEYTFQMRNIEIGYMSLILVEQLDLSKIHQLEKELFSDDLPLSEM